MFLFFSVFILAAVGGGIFLGVIVILVVCRARCRCKHDKKPEKMVPYVSFKIPPPKMDAFTITTQTRYPQQEQDEPEQHSPLDPEIYRYCEWIMYQYLYHRL